MMKTSTRLSGTEKEAALDAPELENAILRAKVLPHLGGKLWTLFHKPTSTEWLWRNPTAELRPVTLGACYDDNWAGGWEELFPNDAPCQFMGRELPDHGEWWSRPWEWQRLPDDDGRMTIYLWHSSTVTDAFCEKWITLDDDSSQLTIRYRIENRGPESLYFLFKQHLAVAVTPEHQIEFPAARVVPVDLDFSTRIGDASPFHWPLAAAADGSRVDLRTLPHPELAHREFVYCYDLSDGWCGVVNTRTGARLRLHFDREVFPYTWLFMTFGGWRDLYTVVLEPCTNMPKDLSTAYELGQCASLAPREALSTTVYAELC